MAKTIAARPARKPGAPAAADPYVADGQRMPEFTWSAVLLGVLLGLVFGASSLYLVLKVGLTVSASIPVAVLSITLFRAFSRVFGLRRATILENNIVQTTGSAGESLAFGVGVTMPALLLLGHDMDLVRVMTVGVLGGLLGILLMIPLRRAFIVRQHGVLTYPEGTACADVLIVGEEGGATAKTVFAGFGIAFVYKLATSVFRLWPETPSRVLYSAQGGGLPGGEIGGELVPELLGVGYIIGPRIASVMVAGGVLSSLVLAPLIALFAANQAAPIEPVSDMLIRSMSPGQIHLNYVLYIGAGAVTAGGVISMLRALPLIVGSIRSGLRDVTAGGAAGGETAAVPRTARDLPTWIALAGSMALVLAIAAVPNLGLGLSWHGLLGAVLIVIFGSLFVAVSARLTGEIGSSSNPISGMTVATLLFTCLIFLYFDKTDKAATLSALSIAAIVCIASSNGGTTAQDLKTGYLVGATPVYQQMAILIGSLTSAVLIGMTLLLLNDAGTVYTRRPEFLPTAIVPNVAELRQMQRPGSEYADQDNQLYHVLHAGPRDSRHIPAGKYLVDDRGQIRYYVDPAINGRLRQRDDGTPVAGKFDAPKTQLMAIIINGILSKTLPWGLVIIGVLLAVTLELAGVPSLPFAVGVYLPIQASVPIFCGGVLRWLTDQRTAGQTAAAGSDTAPGVLLSSGYIAGGTIAGVLAALLAFAPPKLIAALDVGSRFSDAWRANSWPAIGAFAGLAIILLLVGLGRLFGSEPPSAAKTNP